MIRPTISFRPAREKKRGVAVLRKRDVFSIEKFLAFEEERRHPGGIVVVDSPRKLDKRGAIFSRRD